jgi:plasmid stabilization system protein ParE
VQHYSVVFTPEAAGQLDSLYGYVAEAASPEVALRYTNAIVSYCESLSTFPERGTRRDDIRPGLRVTNYKKSAVIAFHVDAKLVSIIGIYYGGQDFESDLTE